MKKVLLVYKAPMALSLVSTLSLAEKKNDIRFEPIMCLKELEMLRRQKTNV